MNPVCAMQEVQLQGLGLWAQHSKPPWPPSVPVDLPRERLMDFGYACLLQEGGLAVCTTSGAGEARAPV